MKQKLCTLVGGVLLLGAAGFAQATPLDLTGFVALENVPGSVVGSAGAIAFAENNQDLAIYFANDAFIVANNATTLSFDFNFAQGQTDVDDYLQFNINYVEQWRVDADRAGHFAIDLSSYQGQTIALDWGLLEGGDNELGASGRIYNIDLAQTQNPVPEPATMLLMGTGLAGVFGAKRKKR